MRSENYILRILLACFLFAVGPTACGYTQEQFESAGLSYDEVKQFYSVLRDAVAKNDRQKVAQLMLYPVGAKVNGKVVMAHNEEEFLKIYDHVFTQKVVESLKNTPFDDLVLQPLGAMTPGGVVWIGGTKVPSKNGEVDAIRVVAINN